MKSTKTIATLLLIFSIMGVPQVSARYSPLTPNAVAQSYWWKTELYFGTDIKGGAVVTEDDWNEFLKEVVTPKFPDGLTVLEGYGQYRDSSGKIVRERSKVVVILYPATKRKSSSRKIDEIRKAYKAKFQQESVLRIDYPRLAKLEF